MLARGVPDGVLIYRESGTLASVSLSELRRMWYGTLYLTAAANGHADLTLRPGMQGEQVRALQQALKAGRVFPG